MITIPKHIHLAIFCLFCLQLNAQNFYWAQQQKFLDSTQSSNSRFARALDVDGDFMMIADFADDRDSILTSSRRYPSSTGLVNCYRRNADSSWSMTQRIVANDQTPGAYFGYSLSMDSSQAVIGAFGNNTDTSGNFIGENCGAAYLFERSAQGSWIQKQKLIASDADTGDGYGDDVDISGNHAIVGAPYNVLSNSPPSNRGSVYFLRKNASGRWNEVQKITTPDSLNTGAFGRDVEINGRYALVSGTSAKFQNNSSAYSKAAGYLYERDLSTGIWNFKQKISPSDSCFTVEVELHNDDLILHSNLVYSGINGPYGEAVFVYEKQANGTWFETQKLQVPPPLKKNRFGYSVAISGNLMAIGAPSEDEDAFGANKVFGAGAVYMYRKDSTQSWKFLQKIVPRDRVRFGTFGNSTVQIINHEFGSNIALNGRDLLVGTEEGFRPPFFNWYYEIGSAYLFDVCNPAQGLVTVAACDSFLWPVDSNTYDSTGIYYAVLPDQFNCDSIVSLNLTIKTKSGSSLSAEECYSYTWPLSGQTYTKSGIYTATLTNRADCDSIVNLDLQINRGPEKRVNVEACEKYLWDVDSNVYNKTGIYQAFVPAASGCDSVITLNLRIPQREIRLQQVGNTLNAIDFATNYQWVRCNPNFEAIKGASQESYTVKENGSFALIATTNGCADTSECIEFTGFGVLSNGECDVLSVTPNPTEDKVSIRLAKSFETISVSLADASGQIVKVEKFLLTNTFDLELPKPKATYFLHLSTNEGCASAIKLVKN